MTKDSRIAKNLLGETSCYDCNHYNNNKCLIDLGDGELPIFLNCMKFKPKEELDAEKLMMKAVGEEMRKSLDNFIMEKINV